MQAAAFPMSEEADKMIVRGRCTNVCDAYVTREVDPMVLLL